VGEHDEPTIVAIASEDVRRVVGRPVVHDDELEAPERLRQHALDRLADVLPGGAASAGGERIFTRVNPLPQASSPIMISPLGHKPGRALEKAL
jgi:hypothetical protein